MSLIEKAIVIANKYGLHGRTSAKLAETAAGFYSDIRLIKDGEEFDAKSILDIMSMEGTKGTVVTIRANGLDADEAIKTLEVLVENRFGEE